MTDVAPNSCTATLGRLFWMMVGPALLGMLTFTIVRTGNGWWTRADFGFLFILIATMLARWIEFRGGNPQTADGQPATPAHLRRYLVTLSVIGLSVWVLANVVGNHIMNRA